MFAVIAIAAAITFLAPNSFFHLAIAANDVGILNALTTGSGVQDQFNQCGKQKDADLDGKLGLSDFASCYSQVFANKSDP